MAASPSTSPPRGVREDAWLGRVLGRPAYSVDSADAPEAPLPTGFYWTKIPAGEIAALARFCALGFVPVDVNVTLVYGGGPPPSTTGVRDAEPSDRESLLDVAGRSFRYSRFHLDPRLPAGLADTVKREWLRSYFEGSRGVEVLVAADGGRPVGFLAVLDAPGARVIDLVAVAPEAQRRGHGSALVAEFVRRHSGAKELRVGTQAANAGSIRLYELLGFRYHSASYVLHLHA